MDHKGEVTVKWIRVICFAAMLGALGGCAGGLISNGNVDVSAWSTNYTEDYIHDFSIRTLDGKRTGVAGFQVKEFSDGGTGKTQCCAPIRGVGQTVQVVWRIATIEGSERQLMVHSRNVEISGVMPTDLRRHHYLLVRFFPGYEVEAELFSGDDFDPKNPRVDRLFTGERVMRHKGE
ncbi:DUF3304 domain-containing protein [Pandoraea norimbergensis]|uniref:DUF3304 domain-containing protein n=1 Tax=Pandoraea norimbergensis TaxID=93219 RepID=A0ABN4JQF5_9BURK|nr:DUF3304 domain-containing protein [Pandoraea norimbergensis]ALS62742.1 hypothetical protein AT302_26020 [Pandoraea norimbergensis]